MSYYIKVMEQLDKLVPASEPGQRTKCTDTILKSAIGKTIAAEFGLDSEQKVILGQILSRAPANGSSASQMLAKFRYPQENERATKEVEI